jgi:hypothetical protein
MESCSECGSRACMLHSMKLKELNGRIISTRLRTFADASKAESVPLQDPNICRHTKRARGPDQSADSADTAQVVRPPANTNVKKGVRKPR